MVVEAVITIVNAVNIRRQEKTARMNRNMFLMQQLSQYSQNMGYDKKIQNFAKEYEKTKDIMKEDSLWQV